MARARHRLQHLNRVQMQAPGCRCLASAGASGRAGSRTATGPPRGKQTCRAMLMRKLGRHRHARYWRAAQLAMAQACAAVAPEVVGVAALFAAGQATTSAVKLPAASGLCAGQLATGRDGKGVTGCLKSRAWPEAERFKHAPMRQWHLRRGALTTAHRKAPLVRWQQKKNAQGVGMLPGIPGLV